LKPQHILHKLLKSKKEYLLKLAGDEQAPEKDKEERIHQGTMNFKKGKVVR